MARNLTIGAAQLGPIAKNEGRAAVVERMLTLLRKAAARECKLVVFPELALTTFFPRYYMEDQAEVDSWFESSMPNNSTQPLFDEARKLGYKNKAAKRYEHNLANGLSKEAEKAGFIACEEDGFKVLGW